MIIFSRMSLDIVQRFNDMYQPIHTRIFVDLVARIEARLASQEDKPDAKASDGRDASGAKAKGALTAAEMVELYQTAFDIAIHSMRAGNACGASGLNWLSDKLEWELVGYLNEPCLVKLNAAKEAGAIALLREWIVRWKAFEIFMRTVASVFAPCGEGTFSVPYNKRPPSEIGPILFHKIIFTPTVHPLSRAVLALIDRHRAGEDVDTMLVARAVQVVVELGFGIHKADSPDRAVFLSLELYRKHIERGFIEAVGAHYDAACAVALQEGTVSEFLIKCSQIVDKERQRVHSYLHRSTLVPLTACLHKCLIKDNVATLLTRKDGLPQFLAEDSRADLARLYDLVKDPQASTGGSGMAGAAAGSSSSSSSVGSSGSAHASQAGLGSCVGRLLMCFQDEVEATGSALLAAEAKDPNRCVDSVLKLRERFVRVIRECFQDNDTAKVHLRSAFERFINKSDKLAMPLAQYAHKMLERGGQLTAQSVENVVSLYGYFRDKDVFEHEYKKNLAERLIKGSSSNESDEKEVITRFKAQSGYQWGTDLETMFGDVASSKTYTADYNNVVGEAARRFDFTAHICSGSSWPIGPAPPAIIPAELKDAPATFESIYLNKNAGRELKWRMDLGVAEVEVQFSPSVLRRLVVETPMMLVLLSFTQKVQSLDQIIKAVGLPKDVLANHLLSMIHPEQPVLKKTGDQSTLADADKFMINQKFDSRMRKITVRLFKTWAPSIDAEDDEARRILNAGREVMTDSALVRIMKARKTLNHNVLITEVTQQLQARFQPDPEFLRKRIDYLMQEDYIERDSNDRRVYNYKA